MYAEINEGNHRPYLRETMLS